MSLDTKYCTACKEEHDIDAFGHSSQTKDGYARICKEQRKIQAQKTREKFAARLREKQMARYEDARAFIMELKSQPCTDCGQTFPWFCMDLDHRDPATKRRPISQMMGSGNLKQLMEEVQKCDVVCSNCHRIRTAIQAEDGLIKMGRPRKYA